MLHFQYHFDHYFKLSILLHQTMLFYLLFSIPPFKLIFALCFKLLKYRRLFSYICLFLFFCGVFLATEKNKLFFDSIKKDNSGRKNYGCLLAKTLSHLQQLSGSITCYRSLCHAAHQVLFIPQLTLTSRNFIYYTCNCAQSLNKHLLFSSPQVLKNVK